MTTKVILSPCDPATPQQTDEITDWDKCCLCQNTSNAQLVNPSNVKRFKCSSYDRLAERLVQLHTLNGLPLGIKTLKRFDDGNGISDTFKCHGAVWHKTCFDLCNNDKIERARKRKQALADSSCASTHTPVKKRLRQSCIENERSQKNTCFFCNRNDKSQGSTHSVETLALDKRIRAIAEDLMDTQTLSKLSVGDMTAIDAVYHKHCLTSFYNRHRSFMRKRDSSSTCTTFAETSSNKATAFAELVTYIESFETNNGKETHIFKLSDLNRMYVNRLKDFEIEVSSNSSHLKEKLLSAIPSLGEHKSNYETMLSFKNDIGNSLLAASQNNIENETLILLRAANIVRKDIFDTKFDFTGSLQDPQYKNIPCTLRVLIEMILKGRDISNETESDKDTSEITDSLTQLVVYNTLKRHKKTATYQRHCTERETLLPLYLGLMVHGRTRRRDLVDVLHKKGICISYDRVMQISTHIANSVITQYEESGVVCPCFLKDGVFTTGNLDNIDHNPTSNTSKDAFHGTAISLTQHMDEPDFNASVVLDLRNVSELKRTKALPLEYTEIPPVSMKSKFPEVSLECKQGPMQTCENARPQQIDWLLNVEDILNHGVLNEDEYISWSGYFASMDVRPLRPPAVSALLPLFRDEAHTVAMIKHGMTIVGKAIAFKNPEQTPVITVDQPLYVLAKKVQWTWPGDFGENKYVVLMGGLHIEMAVLKCIGDWLEASGWLAALTRANVVTAGRAEVVQRGANTSRGQWIHQVMAATLFTLQQRAYRAYTEEVNGDPLSFHDWCTQMTDDDEHSQFHYWSKTLQFELAFLQFLKSQRDADFLLYKQSLKQLMPWLFALDHVHYARWLSIHLQDLENLEIDCPDVFTQFCDGKFVTQRSAKKFSCIAHDQVHEQLNALIKGDGGFKGITENPESLNRWTVASPEVARIISEVDVGAENRSNEHHEQGRGSQSRFFQQTQSLVAAFEELGNPFSEESSDLFALDTKVVLTKEAVASVKNAEQLGKVQYENFIEECIGKNRSIYDPIKKNNLQLFRTGTKGVPSKLQNRMKSMKNDVNLFSRMYIACQSREGDLDSFFEHENHPWPPSLAEQNRPRSGNKSDLVACLETLVEKPTECPVVEMKIVDGSAAVQVLDPKKAKVKVQTFGEYAADVFLPFICKHLQNVVRVDIIWDVYRDSSLKTFTRQMRGSGEQIRVSANTRLPSNWKSFLRNDNNKTQLFQYIASCVAELETDDGKTVISTHGENVVQSQSHDRDNVDPSELQPCDHEEADSRIALHVANAFESGQKSVMVYATDTDVVVITIALASKFPGREIWLAYGHSNAFRYIPVHSIAEHLGQDKSLGLLFLHAFTGCDTVSFFNNVGKKTVFRVWQSQAQLVNVCRRLSTPGVTVTSEDIAMLERFVVLLYAKTSSAISVNEARKELFAQKNRQIENIPPSKCALIQHTKRAVYQSACVWGQMLEKQQTLPPPSDWGWMQEGQVWVPVWSTLPEASKGCRELVKCNCKSACTGRCKCFKSNLPCTQLCLCQAGCEREPSVFGVF